MNGERLPEKTRNAIKNTENKCFLSVASLWEMTIKSSLGKLSLKSSLKDVADFLPSNAISLLPITFEHFLQLDKLQYFHRDPFDRLIIAQGITEALAIVTKDEHFTKYNVRLFWE